MNISVQDMFYWIQGDPCLEFIEYHHSIESESKPQKVSDMFIKLFGNTPVVYTCIVDTTHVSTCCSCNIQYSKLKEICNTYNVKNSLIPDSDPEENCYVFETMYPFNMIELNAYVLQAGCRTPCRVYTYNKGSNEIKRVIPNAQKIQMLITKYIEWKQFVIASNFNDICNSQEPPRYELYPNLKVNFTSEFSHVKYTLAKKWNEVTLLWYIGDKCRTFLHNKGIWNLKHPKLLENLKLYSSPSVYTIQERLIMSLNAQQTPPEFIPNHACSDWVYFDVESESQNLKDTVMVGMLWYTGDKLQYSYVYSSPDAVCQKFFEHITMYGLKKKTFVHYTGADLEFLQSRICELTFLDLNTWINLNYTLSSNVQQLRVFSFGLKHVVSKICEHIGCQDIYSRLVVKDGLTCMKQLYTDKCVSHDVMMYNFTDVLSLYLLHCYTGSSVQIDERLHSWLYSGTDYSNFINFTTQQTVKKRKLTQLA